MKSARKAKIHSQVAELAQSSDIWLRYLKIWTGTSTRTVRRTLLIPLHRAQDFQALEALTSGSGGNGVHIQIWLTKQSCTVIKAQSQTAGWQQMTFFPLSRCGWRQTSKYFVGEPLCKAWRVPQLVITKNWHISPPSFCGEKLTLKWCEGVDATFSVMFSYCLTKKCPQTWDEE